MYEKIIDIIVFVISELKQNKNINEIDFDELHKLGYTKSEISTAFSWLVDRIEFNEKIVVNESNSNNESFRMLHDVEKELFTSDAWGELIQLNTLGLLNNEHIETLIERSLMMGMQQINSENLKFFVANMVFNVNSNNTFSNRYMLQGNDTIN